MPSWVATVLAVFAPVPLMPKGRPHGADEHTLSVSLWVRSSFFSFSHNPLHLKVNTPFKLEWGVVETTNSLGATTLAHNATRHAG